MSYSRNHKVTVVTLECGHKVKDYGMTAAQNFACWGQAKDTVFGCQPCGAMKRPASAV